MKLFALFAVVFGFATFSADPAEARRSGGYGWQESLVYVAETKSPGVSLCRLVKRHTVLFLPVWISAESYALSDEGCVGDSYAPVSEGQFRAMQKSGIIAASLPSSPDVPMSEKGPMYAVWVVGALLVLIGMLVWFRGSGNTPRLSRGARNSTMAAMCTVARADGHIDKSEAQTIMEVSKRLTGKAPDPKKIITMMEDAPASVSETNFDAFAEGLKDTEKRIVMRGALMVAVADGKIESEEYSFIEALAQSLQVRGEEVRSMLRDIAPDLTGASAG